MDPIIDLAPGAEHNPLAARYARALRDNLRDCPRKVRSFRSIRGAFRIVPFDSGDALTMRFDLGRVTIHDGHVGIPSVTIGGPSEALARLDELPISTPLRLPLPHIKDRSGRKLMKHLAILLVGGELKVYGLLSHPRMLMRVLRVLSRNG